jgi:hypothetical protein
MIISWLNVIPELPAMTIALPDDANGPAFEPLRLHWLTTFSASLIQ